MNNIEDYQNLVELLKRALEFYAKKINYDGDIYRISNIAVDNGSQARFALDKIKELEEIYDKMKIDLEEIKKNHSDFINNINMFNEIFHKEE